AAEAGVGCFLAGGAEGFDTLAAEAVIAARGDYPALRLVLALPSRSFLSRRSAAERLRAAHILHAADEAHYASDTDNSVRCMLARNRYLVEHADCCVAYLRRASGGTLYTVNYALERGLPVKNLASEPTC
ncbi:MAG: SLOG family protein, partial [Clostridia bacterium]|nr:SLOG family protein [Clostridia bacterium]